MLQNVHCGQYGVLQHFQLANSPDGTKMRYVYKCCKGSWLKNDENTYYTDWQNGYDAYQLDRHNIKCPNGEALSGFILRRGTGLDSVTDNVRYEFRCKKAALMVPAEYNNDATDTGARFSGLNKGRCCAPAKYGCYSNCGFRCVEWYGRAIFLDRQRVECKQPVQVLTSARLVGVRGNRPQDCPAWQDIPDACCSNYYLDSGYRVNPYYEKPSFNWYYNYECSSADIGNELFVFLSLQLFLQPFIHIIALIPCCIYTHCSHANFKP